MRQIAIRAVVALLLIGLSVSLFHWPYRSLILRGWNDFPGLYTAGALVGGPDLYHKPVFLAREAALAGASDDSIQFSRLPYYALVFRPLSRLPYQTAYWLWQILCVGALVGFSMLWPNGGRILPILCVLPLTAASFANGQDVPFLLLWVAAAFWFQRKRQPVAAGLALALGMAKPHLFLFLPLALIAKKEWRVLAGTAGGATVLIGLSFIAGGAAWPVELMAVWRDPALHPQITHTSLPAAVGSMIADSGIRFELYAALLAALAGVVWFVSRRFSTPVAISAAIACSVVSAVHLYLQDYSLCLPLLLLLIPLEQEEASAHQSGFRSPSMVGISSETVG